MISNSAPHPPSVSTLPDLTFAVEDAGVVEHAAVPTLRFGLGIRTESDTPIATIALRAQLRIAARRRGHDDQTRARLAEVFGGPSTWADALRALPWADIHLNVPAFEHTTTVDLPVACTYDFEVTASKYLHALREGIIPLEFLFSGSVFYREDGLLRVAQISWEKEACYDLPVSVWHDLIDRYFPGAAWLRVDRDTFDRLYAFRVEHGLPSWEKTLDALLDHSEEPPS